MTGLNRNSRHTRLAEPSIIVDSDNRNSLEVKNYFRQYDLAFKLISAALDDGIFKLRPSVILALHRGAYAGLSNFAGVYRSMPALIDGSEFEPPTPSAIPELMEEMCDYVNDRWRSATALHLAAYVMWRLNWIHPFVEGNGSTARMLSYVVLSIRLGSVLPGTPTIPEQIVEDRGAYFDALDAADVAARDGAIDVSRMEALLSSLLAKQLAEFSKLTDQDSSS